ncbi:hypothetical protein FRACYDRAFT_236534 [Fragilariopsis cylindrus CCMP1102]|uniref:Uncharacterized protein n=1 Tax=Fragilariopsis cylindrus CCMP1102 TaxID=635003 RepID=A0A1E7FJB4_9STRA|nr:hypothetical protein FRACYDRAFT_236534 [Fragilariopsis cylindrus CCMP1102]|eukprot:OEU18260.1 hypothetical protein FRACYDRAFT_236534 [Fragilariopsis cylindrus CCMP1102]
MIFFSSSYLILPLLSALLSMGGKRNRNPNKNQKQQQQKAHCLKSGTHHMDLYRQIGSASTSGSESSNASLSSAIWIDMENVRGKSGFLLSHQDVLDKTELWLNHFQLQNKVIVVIDHGGDRGSQPSAYYLEDKKFAIVFSGNACKADDIIAKGIGDDTCFTFFNNNNDSDNNNNSNSRGKTIVVTADVELISRCRRAVKNEYHFINPQTFLDDLEFVVQQEYQKKPKPVVVDEEEDEIKKKNEHEEESFRLTVEEKLKLESLDIEIKLRGQLLDAEIQLGDRRKRKTNNKRKKLDSRVQSLRRKLALRGPSMLDQLTTPNSDNDNDNNNNGENSYVEGIPRDQQDILLAKWKEVQNNPSKRNRKEQTGDRIIYAERLRRELEDNIHAISTQIEHDTTDDSNTMRILPSSKAFVNHIHGYQNPYPSGSSSNALSTTAKSFYGTTSATTTAAVADVNVDIDIDIDIDDTTVITPKLSTEELLKLRNDERVERTEGLEEEEEVLIHPPEYIDIVVISDTHGFEDQLGDKLPDGDVLLHLGDFALDNSSKQAEYRSLLKFDHWLAKQTHIPYKIVIRGNHDPIRYDFTTSKAMYITSPKTLTIYGNFDFTFIPYGNARKLSESGVLKGHQQKSKSLSSPTSGGNDTSSLIIASHIPPYKILDKTYTGKHVGSSFLNNSIRRLSIPPKLWFVGHIHEGRGITKRKFGSSAKNKYEETVIINAANANLGMATHLENGPVVVRVFHNNKKDNDVDNDSPNIEILKMDDRTINQRLFSNNSNNEGSFFGRINNNNGQQQHQQPVAGGGNDYYDDDSNDDDNASIVNTNKLLMSVDLGLKSGISLFSNTGLLLRYEQFDFLNRKKLQDDIIDILYKWENEVVVQEVQSSSSVLVGEVGVDDKEEQEKDDDEESSTKKWKITHIAIEGGDVELLDIWSNAAAPNNYSILRVSPEEWRSELLTTKECSNGKSAKEASRLIARQIVNDYGCRDSLEEHIGKFKTDVAESVCLGMYVSRRLGWIEPREPVIRRYTNGNIIIPLKKKK